MDQQAIVNRGSSYMGPSVSMQVLTGLVLIVLLYLSLSMAEFIYKSFSSRWTNKVNLFPNTYTSGTKMYTAIQNPTNPAALTVNVSNNQRSGVEFSYSMFVYLNSDTFSSGNANLYHILHKGYGQVYPLLGPGIFSWGNKNCIRVFMNCYDTWDNYTDIENIPVDKWFHIVVSCKGNTLYVYINGNLKQKVALSGNTPPYQNYGNVYLFSSRKTTLFTSITSSLQNDSNFMGTGAASSLVFDGAAKGMASRVTYFSYALTYTEIQALMNMGPSSVMDGTDLSLTPYLSDTWWANRQGP
jgi:hypothetical protein